MSDLFRKISTKLALKLVGVLTLALFGATAPAQTQSPAGSTATKDSVVTTHAIGTFEVKVSPYTEGKYDEGTTLGRYSRQAIPWRSGSHQPRRDADGRHQR